MYMYESFDNDLQPGRNPRDAFFRPEPLALSSKTAESNGAPRPQYRDMEKEVERDQKINNFGAINMTYSSQQKSSDVTANKLVKEITGGYIGFANLPNQVYRRSVKKGFEFTLMVVGKCV